MENHYPHKFLTTHHQTLPMSLVWTFVCLATRFGFDARPVSYPGTVLAAIKPPERTEWRYINLFREELTTQTEAELSASLQPGFPRACVQPAATQLIVTRAVNNVFVSAMRETTVQWQALYLAIVFFASQGIRDNTTNALWSFVLQTVNERAPLDLLPIIHDRLLGPNGTSFSPAEARRALQAAKLKCGEDERPAQLVVGGHEGLGDDTRLAVGMMIGPAQFVVGLTNWMRSVTAVDCRNEEQPIRKSARSDQACVSTARLGRTLTASRGIPSLDCCRSVESICITGGPGTIRGRFVRDRDGRSEAAGTL